MSALSEAYPSAKIQWVKSPGRSAENDNKPVAELVAGVLADVKARGDAAVRDYSAKFDKAEVGALEITMAEREAAVAALDPQTRKDTEFAIANVRRFAEAQLATILPLEMESLPGVHMGHRVIPIDRVGCYVPGGRFPLLSAPIMTIVPAKVAGVKEVIDRQLQREISRREADCLHGRRSECQQSRFKAVDKRQQVRSLSAAR